MAGMSAALNVGKSNSPPAFDPIFFLHHCNVDRLYALWEYVYPEYWMGTNGYVDASGNRIQFSESQSF